MASPQTIQPSSADAYFYEGNGNTTFGTQTLLAASPGAVGARYTSAITLDFSASVPAGAAIATATLSLSAITAFKSGRTLTVYRLLRTDWIEAQATWNSYKTGSNWGTGGGLNTSTDIATTDAATAASRSSAGWVDWDVKNQVQTALDSVGGIAHFLLADVGSAVAALNCFASREYSTNTSLRPKLYIEYVNPGPPALLKTVDGLAVASVKTLRSGLLIASGKTWNGLA